MWFCKDKRGEVKEAHPDWGVADIGKEMGALWKKISDKDKKKYEGEAAKDKERYEKVGAASMVPASSWWIMLWFLKQSRSQDSCIQYRVSYRLHAI
jgi:uncharacterized protein (DUF736 family)